MGEQMKKQNELRQQQLLRQQMMERQRQEEVLAAQGFPNSVPAPVMQVNAPLNNKITPQQLNHIEQQRQQQINNLNEPQVTGPSNVDNIINKITQERLKEKKKLEENNIMISDE